MSTRTFYRLSLLSIMLGLVGCATGPQQKNISPAATAMPAPVYQKPVPTTPVSEARFKAGQCREQYQKIKSKWDKKLALTAANACVKWNEWETLDSVAQEISKRDPSSPWGPYFAGVAAKSLKRWDRALWMAELALKRAPKIGVVHYLQGQILWEKKDYNLAVKSFEKAVELDSDLVTAHRFLGQVFLRDQDYKRARDHFAAVLKFTPGDMTALSGIAESELQMGRSGQAKEYYQRAVAHHPDNESFQLRLAEIHEQSGELQQAVDIYKRIQKRRSPSTANNELVVKIKELELSIKKSQRSVAEAPTARVQ